MPLTPETTTSTSDQLIRTAQQFADEILCGVVTPYQGGRRIWRECQLKLASGDHRLDPFVYWSSEYEETSDKERQALCDKALRVASTLLVKHGSAL